MSGDPDLLVLGAGPAGTTAALAAASCGVDVLLVDEGADAGGQIYRPMPPGFRPTAAGAAANPDLLAGEDLRHRLAASAVRRAFGRQVWSVSPSLRVDALGPDGPETWQPQALVVATGTSERVIPFPGWTLPGVIGLAGATILLKAQQMLPGQRTLVAGCGPLLAAVGAGILKGGGSVAAVVDVAGRRDWLATAPALVSAPDLLARGRGWLAALRQAKVPLLQRHAVQEVRAAGEGLEATIAPVDRDGRFVPNGRAATYTVDSVAVGNGLVPATEVTRLLGAAHEFDNERGGWVARHDADFRTTVARVYVAGDGAGIRGARCAALQGHLAGLAAAADLGRLDRGAFRTRSATIRRRLRRAERFGAAMGRLMAPRPGQAESIRDDTVVCRCEDVTRAEIAATLADGATEVNQVKAATRCGMGPCQGRLCGEAVAMLVALAVGSRERAGQWTARPPLRPLPIDRLCSDGDYASIPIPQAAPA